MRPRRPPRRRAPARPRRCGTPSRPGAQRLGRVASARRHAPPLARSTACVRAERPAQRVLAARRPPTGVVFVTRTVTRVRSPAHELPSRREPRPPAPATSARIAPPGIARAPRPPRTRIGPGATSALDRLLPGDAALAVDLQLLDGLQLRELVRSSLARRLVPTGSSSATARVSPTGLRRRCERAALRTCAARRAGSAPGPRPPRRVALEQHLRSARVERSRSPVPAGRRRRRSSAAGSSAPSGGRATGRSPRRAPRRRSALTRSVALTPAPLAAGAARSTRVLPARQRVRAPCRRRARRSCRCPAAARRCPGSGGPSPRARPRPAGGSRASRSQEMRPVCRHPSGVGVEDRAAEQELERHLAVSSAAKVAWRRDLEVVGAGDRQLRPRACSGEGRHDACRARPQQRPQRRAPALGRPEELHEPPPARLRRRGAAARRSGSGVSSTDRAHRCASTGALDAASAKFSAPAAAVALGESRASRDGERRARRSGPTHARRERLSCSSSVHSRRLGRREVRHPRVDRFAVLGLMPGRARRRSRCRRGWWPPMLLVVALVRCPA